MVSRRLYIMGNGFDLHHGIKSSYWNFRDYVKGIDQPLFDSLEKYFNADELWSDIEGTLADIDVDTIKDEAADMLVSYGVDDWSDAYHHDYQFVINTAIEVITVNMKKHFTKWIVQLEIGHMNNSPRLYLPRSSNYITFNYTDTLEKLYQIPSGNIMYIHNKAINDDSLLILGHSRNPREIEHLNDPHDIEEQDPRVVEGNYLLDSYFSDTYKDTKTIINENELYFSNLKEIEEIYIIGHSLSPVDIKYFETILLNINADKVQWIISYHSENDIIHHRKALTDIGVNKEFISFKKISEISINPNQTKLF